MDGLNNHSPTEDAVHHYEPPHKIRRIHKEYPRVSNNRGSSEKTRTGQACDRCKTRKIKCDDTKGACLPCRQNFAECRSTDRVTQRATVRGHTELVENENACLKQRVAQLELLLTQNNIDIGNLGSSSQQHADEWFNVAKPCRQWSQNKAEPGISHDRRYTSQSSDRSHEANVFAAQHHRSATDGESHSSKYAASNQLGLMKGLSLSVFGMEVDFGDFLPMGPESSDENQSAMSYRKVIDCITTRSADRSRTPKTNLPPYDEMLQYARMFADALNPWLPVLHRPAFLELVDKFYQKNDFQPTLAEEVIVRMALAISKYQVSVRSHLSATNTKELAEQALEHYHFCLSKTVDLFCNRKVADFQAMTLLCIFLRGFPAPGAACILSTWVVAAAVESGLHRSAGALPSNQSQDLTDLDVELRKRIFWVLMTIHVPICGRLGRPMTLHLEDYDIEFPEFIDDRLSSELDASAETSCSAETGIVMMKMTELFMDAYSCVYAIRPSSNYEDDLERLELQAKGWKDALPSKFRVGSPDSQTRPMMAVALWVQLWEAEFQLLIHHPALCRTTNPAIISSNLDRCMEVSSTILDTIPQLNECGALDTSWCNAMVYIAAIFTLLYAYGERRDSITSNDVKQLENRMTVCLNLTDSVGKFDPLMQTESAQQVRDKIRKITDTALGIINRYLVEKTASAAFASTSTNNKHPGSPPIASSSESKLLKTESNATHQPIQRDGYRDRSPYEEQHQNDPRREAHMRSGSNGNIMYSQRSLAPQPSPKISISQNDATYHSSPPQQSSYAHESSSHYSSQHNHSFSYTPHSPYGQRSPSQHQHTHSQSQPFIFPHNPAASGNYQMASATQPAESNPYPMMNSWHRFTEQVKDDRPGSESEDMHNYDSASALVQLGSAPLGSGAIDSGTVHGGINHVYANLATVGHQGSVQGINNPGWPPNAGFDETYGRGGPASYG